MLRKALLVGCGSTLTLGAVTLVFRPDLRREAAFATQGSWRVVRTVWQAALVAVDYKWSFRGLERGMPEYRAMREIVDTRAAQRLLEVCRSNGGMYTKAGQYLASMNHVLPPAYTEVLAVLQDRAAYRPLDEVRRVIEGELGAGALESCFSEFSPKPVASASLAQVHKAVTRDGREVAVKVQYPGLERQVTVDMFTVRLLVNLLGRAFPGFEFSWMLPEFEDSLKLELDFRQEARNGERVAAMFAAQPDVHVPAVLHNLTSRRLLTMEYVNGVKPTDKQGLAGLGVEPKQLAGIASRTFGDMIHVHGFVHCDPHPGNLLVRRNEQGVAQLVVLDHGMYRRLDQNFREAYCRLWKGMILADGKLVEAAAREMGLGVFAEILPLLFVYRPVSSSSTADIGKNMSAQQRDDLKRKFKGTTMQDVNKFMRQLPRDMLFVMRATNLVRSLNKELGGTTRQRIRLMAESAVRGLALDRGYTDTTRDADAPAPAIVAVDEQSGKRIDTDSVFDAHRINAPVDSELLAQQGSGGMSTRGWLRQWWDVRRLRFRMFVVDQAASWALWWRGTTAEEAMQRLEEGARRGGRKAGRQMG